MTTQEVVTTTPSKKPVTIEQMLEAGKDQIQKALPSLIGSDRFIRVALTEIRKNPQLQRCSPVSICSAVMQAAQLGLEIGGTLGFAYLIPYKDEATFQVGYKGLMHLARRSGEIKRFEARCVYDGDHFDYWLGTNPTIDHKPLMKYPGPKTLTHVYAVVTFSDGSSQFEVMSADDIEEHRKKYTRGGGDTWTKSYEAMAKKTTIKRLIKLLPISTDLQEALNADNRVYEAESHDPDKKERIENGQMLLSQREADHAASVLGGLFHECAEVGVNTDDLILDDTASPAQVLAATQILRERLEQWKTKSNAN